jgi:hypothetical protein
MLRREELKKGETGTQAASLSFQKLIWQINFVSGYLTPWATNRICGDKRLFKTFKGVQENITIVLFCFSEMARSSRLTAREMRLSRSAKVCQ